MTNHVAKRRLQHAEHDCHVRHGAAHRTGGVLAVRNRNDAVLRDKPDGGFETDNEVIARRTND